MELRELSKLQVRAEVLTILQQLSANADITKLEQDKYLDQLRSIKDQNSVLEIFVKELAKVDQKKAEIISFFLVRLGTLEKLRDTLWTYIKNPSSSDELREISTTTLKLLGENINPDHLFSYFDNPKELIDKETQRLLETSIMSPEAQIDFMDFLFTLPENEQIQLIESLKDDFSSEELVYILVPALESLPKPNIAELIIETLGSTRSPLAAPALLDLIKYSDNEKLKKLALKSLNLLKIAGIDIENCQPYLKKTKLCSITSIYECFTSQVDGIGNQGLIISRIKENQNILMFSVVINDQVGIIDCFGFNDISTLDFKKIIDRFEQHSTRINVSPEYCKYMLGHAETINKLNKKPISYEYAAWKALLYDVDTLTDDPEDKAKKWFKENQVDNSKMLYTNDGFKCWFLEDDDHPLVKPFLHEIIASLIENKDYYRDNTEKLKEWLSSKLDELMPKIFDNELRKIYSKRLLNAAYLLNEQGLIDLRNIASTVAMQLISANGTLKVEFMAELLRNTLYEGILRHQYNIEQLNKPKDSVPTGVKKLREINNTADIDLSKQDLDDIIKILYQHWFNTP